ncbi:MULTISPECIES: nucleotidyltransferase domain-containing protein [unclassified Alteromonas]|uniref:nucleotidyltransferase domain-containing protein n=1 Tax=unclassified Alteromonas TaxID=2614992 RepID=UPI000B64C6DD|nr:nucleotidyltransferase [Alteromonas sp.]MCG7649680.1 nucleotidyltransferase [Alteromonas sp. MmMcT2-5]OUX88839.1 MAG: nucleotidyltransferase [Alteromonas sp. TMED35]
MAILVYNFSQLLEEVAKELDISPSKYKLAVSRYESVAKWINGGKYESFDGKIKIYPQGSFRLGTVVRPIREQTEKDYDIDLVCEFEEQATATQAKIVKHRVGNRLKEHTTYKAMLDEEGRRCWTLLYSEQDGAGFHLDVLPSSGYSADDFYPISITHKENESYSWASSNPKGYAAWFDARNVNAYRLVALEQKRMISNSCSDIYAKIDDVPDQLIRTPLQRAIQLMKRHRDMRFDGNQKYAPISMIMTTLAAHLYNNETNVYEALTNIVNKLSAHMGLLDNKVIVDERLSTRGLIKRLPDGTWYISNPTNPEENFADRWHENGNARAKAFFQWVDWLKRDFLDVPQRDRDSIRFSLEACIGKSIVNKVWSKCIPSPDAQAPANVNISGPAKPWRVDE